MAQTAEMNVCWKRNRLFYVVNDMATVVLATEGAWALAVMALI